MIPIRDPKPPRPGQLADPPPRRPCDTHGLSNEARVNAALLRVYQNLLESVAEQMGSALERTGFSPNIKERRDYSCAVFDGKGRMLAHAAHIPVHLGSTQLSVEAAIARGDLGPGDVVLLNDPYCGGTHLPDLTVVSAVFEDGDSAPRFYVANRAHHADVGGAARGSMGLSTEIYQEGLRLPPIKIMESGRWVRDILTILHANMRQPDERDGDLRAQLGALDVGRKRLAELLASPRRSELLDYGGHLLDAAERHVRTFLESIPDGEYGGEEFLDDDGFGDVDIPIRVRLRIDGSDATIDFTGTAPTLIGSLNANPAITRSAVFYVIRALSGAEIPANAGLLRPITIRVPPGCLLDPAPPAAVAGGNVETSQRIVDTLLAAMAPACPRRVPAQSQGTMNNLTLGGRRADGSGYSYYETIGGGCGAGSWGPGASAAHSHMTNTRNTPVEALEHAIPVRVTEYSVRRGSGGAGRYRGGDGIVREIEALEPLEFALLTERRRRGPRGLAGGEDGRPGRNLRVRESGTEVLPGKCADRLSPGDRLRLETPGGGGWGSCIPLSSPTVD
ncbi:MAG: hydantoinase B/oxoprolinase family protein [Planctomycetes bacterium]|nr:hydantoinase B/oxoprolinase family protein [Planctomycetota bacterium]